MAGPALALANNLPADNADNRFHGAFYGPVRPSGQGVKSDPAATGSIYPVNRLQQPTSLKPISALLEIRPPFSEHKSRIAS
ncbi:hypothetical protein [Rhizobium sp.]|uniref:hypothetical protein n=1 Tax=Rhizobium sp. TaxID=391 RepID=UPI003899C921